MTAKCYNGPGAYANLEFDNWPWASTGYYPMDPWCPVKAMLLTDVYVPDLENDSTYNDIKDNECSGPAYPVPGGLEIYLDNTIASDYVDLSDVRNRWYIEDFYPPVYSIPAIGQLKEGLKDPAPPVPAFDVPPRYCVYFIDGIFSNPLIAVQDIGAGWESLVEKEALQVFVILEDGAAVTNGFFGLELKEKLGGLLNRRVARKVS